MEYTDKEKRAETVLERESIKHILQVYTEIYKAVPELLPKREEKYVYTNK